MSKVIYEGDWSFPVRKEFILNPDISRGAKVLYLALKSYCAPNHSESFPSTKLLSHALGVERKTIGRWAKELTAKGFLKIIQQHKPNGDFDHILWKIYGSNSHEHI